MMRAVYAHGDQWRNDDGPVALPSSADTLFNLQRYHGGALVLYALRQKIGGRGLRAPRARVGDPLPRRRWRRRMISSRSRPRSPYRDLRGFLRAWVYGTTTPPMPGHPDWTVDPVVPQVQALASLSPRPTGPLRCAARCRASTEREGFEPSDEVDPRHTISSRARSAAPAPLLEERRVSLAGSGSDLPLALDEDRDAVALGGDAGDRHLGRSDHEVDVDLALVRAVAVVAGDQEREALAEREVAGRVLVDQRVVEDRVELADAARRRRPARPRRGGRRRCRARRSCASCPAPCRRRSALRGRPRSASAGCARRCRRPARAACSR